jgi:hypothetical protein
MSKLDAEEIIVRFTTLEESRQIGELWSDLEHRLGSPGIMCSWNWVETWLHHYGDRVRHCFAVGEHQGRPIGIALVTGSAPVPVPGIGFHGVVHLGTAGEPRGESVDVEYNRLAVEPELRAAFASSLINAIRRRYKPFAIQLDGFVPEVVVALAAESLNFSAEDRPCPTFDFERARLDNKDVLASLGSGVRSRIRRSDRGFGELQHEWASTKDEALDIFNELTILHQARWQREGRRGAFASTRFSGFHREFISRSMNDEPCVMLFRLRQNDRTIGCLYGFIEHGTLMFYQSGFIDVDDNRLKPGLSTHAACMQECMNRGFLAYNFLAGEARYKRELANSERMLKSAVSYRFQGTPKVLDGIDRLGLIEKARSIKRWRERSAVSRMHPDNNKPSRVVES